MAQRKKNSGTRAIIGTAAAVLMLLLSGGHPAAAARVAAGSGVELGPVLIAPARLSPGQFPEIKTRIDASSRTGGDGIVTLVAVITRPDNRIKSWVRQNVDISRDPYGTITVPKVYDTTTAGAYRVEILVYSGDMKHRLARGLGRFEVVDRRYPAAAGSVGTAQTERKRSSAGVGAYGNALNPAAGGTIVLWPSRYWGVQGVIAAGTFTTQEGRVLVKKEWFPDVALYGGIGYLRVRAKKDVIGVAARFEDDGMSGVAGVEFGLGAATRLYLEVSAARIELEGMVSNGARTVHTEVNYAPVSIGVSLVMMLF
jgi:hypothetical protein